MALVACIIMEMYASAWPPMSGDIMPSVMSAVVSFCTAPRRGSADNLSATAASNGARSLAASRNDRFSGRISTLCAIITIGSMRANRAAISTGSDTTSVSCMVAAPTMCIACDAVATDATTLLDVMMSATPSGTARGGGGGRQRGCGRGRRRDGHWNTP